MRKLLIVLGVVFLLAGLIWPFLQKIPLGRLPGDIVIDKPNLKVYIPITSMLILSILLSLIMYFLRKWF